MKEENISLRFFLMSEKMTKIISLPNLIRIKKTDEHVEVLYELIKNRKFNISNNKLPNFSEHKSFVINNPYRAWYLIEVDKLVVGTVYILKNNCIGIFVKRQDQYLIKKTVEWVLRNKKPLPEIKSVRPKNFYINVAPNNKILSSALEDIGAIKIQVTYSFEDK